MTVSTSALKTSSQPLSSVTRRSIGVSVLLFIVTVVVRVIVASMVYGIETHDTHYFRVVADVVLTGGSPYDLPWDYANYPPFWSYVIPAGFRMWGFLLNVPFDFMIKLFPILMDGFVTSLLYLVLAEKASSTRWAALWALLYALNPLPINNNAYAGQVDSLPIGLAFIATVMMTRADKRWLLAGAVTLGCAMSFKAYPVVLFPFFLWEVIRRFGWNWRWLSAIAGLTFLPFILQFLPFVVMGQITPLSRMLTYMFLQSGGGGLGVFGWLGIVKMSGFPIAKLTVDTLTLPASWGVLGSLLSYGLDAYRILLLSKFAFGLLYLLLIARGKRLDLATAALLTMLLIFVVIGSYFAYYYMWLLPFAIWLRSKYLIPYSLLGVLADLTESPILNLLVWGICVIWLVRCLQRAGWFEPGSWPKLFKELFDTSRPITTA